MTIIAMIIGACIMIALSAMLVGEIIEWIGSAFNNDDEED